MFHFSDTDPNLEIPSIPENMFTEQFPPLGRGSAVDKNIKILDTFQPPLAGQLEYRGWYRITSGRDQGKSIWRPYWSKYGGDRNGVIHQGCDLFAYNNETIYAISDGNAQYNVVTNAGWGNIIYLYFKYSGSKFIGLYAHLDPSSSFSGVKSVKKGDILGKAGCTGNAGPNVCNRDYHCNGKIAVEDHLHMEIWEIDAQGRRIGISDPVGFGSWSVNYAMDSVDGVCARTVQLA